VRVLILYMYYYYIWNVKSGFAHYTRVNGDRIDTYIYNHLNYRFSVYETDVKMCLFSSSFHHAQATVQVFRFYWKRRPRCCGRGARDVRAENRCVYTPRGKKTSFSAPPPFDLVFIAIIILYTYTLPKRG